MLTVLLKNTHVPFLIKRSARRKRTVALSVDPSGHLIVRASLRAKLPTIENIIQKHHSWILERLASHKQQSALSKRQFTADGVFSYLGGDYRLKIMVGNRRHAFCQLNESELHLHLPAGNVPSDSTHIKSILESWYYHQARKCFAERLTLWQQRLDVTAGALKLSRARTRWGSCNVHNIIRLNWRLIMAPLPLLDYVVAHELCHIIHKNHAPSFWNLLASVMPDYKKRKQALKQQGENWLRDF